MKDLIKIFRITLLLSYETLLYFSSQFYQQQGRIHSPYQSRTGGQRRNSEKTLTFCFCYRQTDRPTDRHIDRQTDRPTDRPTESETKKKTMIFVRPRWNSAVTIRNKRKRRKSVFPRRWREACWSSNDVDLWLDTILHVRWDIDRQNNDKMNLYVSRLNILLTVTASAKNDMDVTPTIEPTTANPKTSHLAISLVCNMTRVPPGMRNELASFVIELIEWKGFDLPI